MYGGSRAWRGRPGSIGRTWCIYSEAFLLGVRCFWGESGIQCEVFFGIAYSVSSGVCFMSCWGQEGSLRARNPDKKEERSMSAAAISWYLVCLIRLPTYLQQQYLGVSIYPPSLHGSTLSNCPIYPLSIYLYRYLYHVTYIASCTIPGVMNRVPE